MNVTILYGGQSAEHDVSILSAFNIANAALEGGYTIQPIYITKEGHWLKGDLLHETVEHIDQLKGLSLDCRINPGDIAQEDTVVFPALHGPNGEDGTIQGFLEVLNLPYVGSGVTASACGMDKIISKQLFEKSGLPQVPYVAFNRRQWEEDQASWIQKCEGNLLYPFFVKPANMGSSVGISCADNQEELIEAVKAALVYDSRIVVEQGITADECEVAVLGNEDLSASVVGRLVKDVQFYDYDEKYINNTVTMEIPAQLPEAVTDKIQKYALQAFQAIDGQGLSRVDFFVTSNHDIYINEINTMPGFTKFSMYPELWRHTGLSFRDLVEELIQLALRKHQARQALQQPNVQ